MTAISTNGGSSAVPLLEVSNVTAFYGDLQALFGVTLRIHAGEIVTLIGSNGAGKTTLLRVISGIKRAAGGSVRFVGEDVSRVPGHEMVARGVSHVPEGRQVFPFLTVRENLSLGAYTPRARPHLKQTMEEQLTLFPRLAERMNQLAGTLSGGEQQMCAIGRGLMSEPQLLMLDEPSLGLAPKLVDEIFEFITSIARQGVTILLVGQNVNYTLQISHYGYVMETGRIVLEGTSQMLMDNEFVRRSYLGIAES